ncbi:hypothetical protein CC86DRAFT_386241 [Ophiobolus disseminans]|uniref:Protein kinase domain-containing protein n=1 Tax=Ophiobolus disseminans TaxID=1469910 RepID=A0A6A6ZLX7_9PLEO|nr:hypothetical protein CC86DRAFT_386241 [Ophiobolus disseminans]
MEHDISKPEIWLFATDCKSAFANCISTPALGEQNWIRSAQGNSNLWCAGIKATRASNDKSSLDSRLRKQTWQGVREDICDLLRGLNETLRKCQGLSTASGTDVSLSPIEEDVRSEQSWPDSPHSHVSWEVMSKESGDPASDESQTEDDSPHLGLTECILYIKTILNQFVKITLAIRRSGNKYRFEDIDASCDEAAFEPFQQGLVALILKTYEGNLQEAKELTVEEKIRQAFDASRLTPVQKRLRYAAFGPTGNFHSGKNSYGTRFRARDQANSKKAFFLDCHENDEDRGFTSISSQTLTWFGRDSKMSILSRTVATRDIRSKADLKTYRAHVAQHIIPYTCIVEDCKTPDEMYFNAESLIAHTLEKHSLARWTCDYCAASASESGTTNTAILQQFDSAEEWTEHVAKLHKDVATEEELPILSGLNKRQMIFATECPLCPFSVEGLTNRIDDHILLHLHEFSLLALPDDAWGFAEKTQSMSQGSDALSAVHEHESADVADIPESEITTDKLNQLVQSARSLNRRTTHGGAYHYLDLPHISTLPSSRGLSEESARELWVILRVFNSLSTNLLECARQPSPCLHVELKMLDTRQGDMRELIEDLDQTARFLESNKHQLDGRRVRISFVRAGSLSSPINAICHITLPPLPSADPDENLLEGIDEIPNFPHVQPRTQSKESWQPRLALLGPEEAGTYGLAAHFAHRTLQSSEDWHVFWVDARSIKTIIHSYDLLTKTYIYPREHFTSGSTWTQDFLPYLEWNIRGNWLVVYDGLTWASSSYLCLENLLASGLKGSLMFTTSDRTCLELLKPVYILEIEGSDWMAYDGTNPSSRHTAIDEALIEMVDQIFETSSFVSQEDAMATCRLTAVLNDAMDTSNFSDPPRKYILDHVLHSLATEDVILQELRRFQLRYETSEKLLATWTHEHAPKIFAICSICDLPPFAILLAMTLFNRDNFDDTSLPIADPALAPPRTFFDSRLWTDLWLTNFYKNQWMFLVPDFSINRFDYTLSPESILPFTKLDGPSRNQADSLVHKIQVHSYVIRMVSLSETSVTTSQGDAETWESEARILSGLTKSRRANILPCSVAIRIGDRRFLMFPWLPGGTLRDYWSNSSRRLGHQAVYDMISQLRGVADAIDTLHQSQVLNDTEGLKHQISLDHENIPIFLSDDGQELLLFGHSNIRPKRLLRSDAREDSLGTLQIANMGYASQARLATLRKRRQTMQRQQGGIDYHAFGISARYEATEVLEYHSIGKTRLSDIWSLGCVTLEFIIWLLYGNEALEISTTSWEKMTHPTVTSVWISALGIPPYFGG